MAIDKMHYKHDNLTVVWQPGLCIHSGNCVRGLNQVFNNRVRPWINMQGAEQDAIIEQVKKCPSGALSFIMDEANETDAEK